MNKATFLHNGATFYTEAHIFPEIAGFYVTSQALGREFLASKCTNSRHGHPARNGDMAKMAMAQGRRTTGTLPVKGTWLKKRRDNVPIPHDVLEMKPVSCL
jgi:hypothetical protein